MSNISELQRRLRTYTREQVLSEMGQHQPNNPIFHVYSDELRRRDQRFVVATLIVGALTLLVAIATFALALMH